MNFKPDWYKSRTFRLGIIAFIGEIAGSILAPDTLAAFNEWLKVILPVVLLSLGITERKDAAPVKVKK